MTRADENGEIEFYYASVYTWQLGALKSRLEHPEVYAQFEDVEETVARLHQWLAENEPKGGTL